jgi:TPR repeat protein
LKQENEMWNSCGMTKSRCIGWRKPLAVMIGLVLSLAASAWASDGVVIEKPAAATKYVEATTADFGLWVDPAIWKPRNNPDNLFMPEFTDSRGKIIAILNAHQGEVSPEELTRMTMERWRMIAPDYHLVSQQAKMTGDGKDVMFLIFDGTVQTEPVRTYGYYYSGPEGTVQLVVTVPMNLKEKYEAMAEDLLDGLQIGNAGPGASVAASPATNGAETIAPSSQPAASGTEEDAIWKTAQDEADSAHDEYTAKVRSLFALDPEGTAKRLEAKSGNGDMGSRLLLALYYANGDGVKANANPKRAVEYMKQAAIAHYPAAESALASWYATGFLVPKNPAKAEALARSAASEGDPSAQLALGSQLLKTDPKTGAALIMKAAMRGIPDAECDLAICYRDGIGVPKDPGQEIQWLQRAAGHGLQKAQTELAKCYILGQGTEKNPAEAAKLFQALAEAGDVNGENNYGYCLWTGSGVQMDRASAIPWLLKAAEHGNAQAAYTLAIAYWTGDAVEKSRTEAVNWFQKSAEGGLAKGECMLGLAMVEGVGTPMDKATGYEWLEKASAQGDPKAESLIASRLLHGVGVPKDYNAALKLLTDAAGRGNPGAEALLGDCYGQGWGVAPDPVQSFEWYKKAAEQGWAQAQLNVGIDYRYGKGVQADMDQAIQWFRRAADNENPYAQFQLGFMYVYGKGVPADPVEAARWFRFSAMQGNPLGENAYGYSLAIGSGVDKDLVEAYKWYILAIAHTDNPVAVRNAAINMKNLEPLLTPAQITEARKRAAAFVPANPQREEDESASVGLS